MDKGQLDAMIKDDFEKLAADDSKVIKYAQDSLGTRMSGRKKMPARKMDLSPIEDIQIPSSAKRKR